MSGRCTTTVVANARNPEAAPTVYSDCVYHHQTLKYKQAAHSGRDGKCSNVPVVCKLDGCGVTIWKYNALIHLWFIHGDGTTLPAIPSKFWVDDIWIPQAEEKALGIDPTRTSSFRRGHGVQSSVDVQNLRGNEVFGVTRRRTNTVSSVGSDAHRSNRPRRQPQIPEQSQGDEEDYEQQLAAVDLDSSQDLDISSF
jgi:hypothetical protein